jgi:hypothetical protein
MCFVRCETFTRRSKHDLGISDTVTVSGDSGQVQFYGTHIFMDVPAGFRFDTQTASLSRDAWTYIDAEDAPMSMSDREYEVTRNPDNQKSAGFTVYYRKDFNYRGDSATIVYGLDKTKKDQPHEKIIFAFGDNTGSAMITAHFRVAHDEDRKTIIKSLLSAYRVDTATIELSAIQRFDVDLPRYGYRFYTHFHSGFYYTIGGKGNPWGGAFSQGIIISEEVPLADDEAIRQRVEDIAASYGNESFHHETREDNPLVINGLYAYEDILQGSFHGRATVYYTLMVQNTDVALCFQALADSNVEESLQAFRKIARSLRLK